MPTKYKQIRRQAIRYQNKMFPKKISLSEAIIAVKKQKEESK